MVLLRQRKKGSSRAGLAWAARHLQMRDALRATCNDREDTGNEIVGALEEIQR